MTPATERLLLNGSQKLTFNPYFNAMVGGFFRYENVYFTQRDRYGGSLRELDSREVRLQDAYVEARFGMVNLRLGNQQVVWGESFGNAYADILNPKDLRDGIPLDLATIRRSIPMANLRLIWSDYSLQGLIIPSPQFDINPQPGSDFAPLKPSQFGYERIVIERETHLSDPSPELGARLTATIGAVDLSVLHFAGYDRQPVYRLDQNSVLSQTLQLQEAHERVKSTGVTFAADVEGYVARAEVVYHDGRHVPKLTDAGMIDMQVTDQLNSVASVDLPTWRSLNFSLQVADSRYLDHAHYLMRRADTTYAGARALLSVFRSSQLELQASHSLTDRGERLHADWMTPLGSRFEFHFGAQIFTGPSESEFGRIQGASRVYASLKSFWSGINPQPTRRSRRAK